MKHHIPTKNIIMLQHINTLFCDEKIDWILSGSTALALYGLDVEVHDIDLIVQKKDLDKISKLFEKYTTRQIMYLQSDEVKMRSYWGTYMIDGVELDIISEIEHKVDDVWKTLDVDTTIEIEFEGMKIKMLTLEAEHEEYTALGRIEKANKISRAMTAEKI